MKLSCPRQALQAALATVSGIVPQRSPKEILRNVKLTLADGTATLLGTDEEVGIRCELAEVITESVGDVLLPTQRVIAILRELQDETVQLEVEDDALWIRSHQSEFRLSVEDAAQFPSVARFEADAYYILPGRQLKQGIQRTIFSTDTESTRYALGGILLDIDASQLTLAATDGRRLAVARLESQAHGKAKEEGHHPVVPSKAMALLERSIQDGEQPVHLAVHPNHVLVRSGPITIYARLVEGRFPKYQDVIPREFTTSVTLVASPVLSAVRQAMIVTSEESRSVDFTFADGLLTLTSVGQDVGRSRIQVPISYDADELVTTLDPRFVQEFLRVLEPASPFTANLIDGNSAVVFTSESNYTYVVMPLARDDNRGR